MSFIVGVLVGAILTFIFKPQLDNGLRKLMKRNNTNQDDQDMPS